MTNILIWLGLLAFGLLYLMMTKKKRIKKPLLDISAEPKDKILVHAERQTKLLTEIEFYLRFFFYLTVLGIVLSIIGINIMFNS